MKRKTIKKRDKKWLSLNDLADFIAEYNRDGKYNKTAWQFFHWLDRKCKRNGKES